jgi:hypothetical protein
MIRKYTRASRKLFGLKFQEPLFGTRTVRGWNLESTAAFRDSANAGIAVAGCQEEAAPGGLESGRRLRRRRRETH